MKYNNPSQFVNDNWSAEAEPPNKTLNKYIKKANKTGRGAEDMEPLDEHDPDVNPDDVMYHLPSTNPWNRSGGSSDGFFAGKKYPHGK